MAKKLFDKYEWNRLACFKTRHSGVLLFFAVFLGCEFAVRTALLLKAGQDVSWDLSLAAAFGWGILYDLGTACWISIPLILLLTILPGRFFTRTWGRWSIQAIVFSVIYLLIFGSAAEWVFWDKFGVRFNFIAVDYLVYTREVVDNILESYPIPLLLSGIGLLSLIIHFGLWKTGLPPAGSRLLPNPPADAIKNGLIWFVGVVATGFIINQNWLPDYTDNYNKKKRSAITRRPVIYNGMGSTVC